MNKTSQQQLEWAKTYMNKFDDIKIRVPKGHRDIYKQYAAAQNISLNTLFINLVNKDMKAHGFEAPASGEPLSKKD